MGVKVSWTNPTKYTDGTPYAQTDNAGYVVQVDGVGQVAVPVAWATSVELANLAVWPTLSVGNHTVTVAVVSKDGVQSDYAPAATFQVLARKPSPVTNLAVV